VKVLLEVSPKALSFAANVRSIAKPSPGLIASVREVGVLQAISAYPGSDGLVVKMGVRRTLAALEAECESVPVVLVDPPAEVDRVVDQMVENLHREDLSTADRVRGWAQLEAFGLSATAIARKLGDKKADVRAGLVTAKSELATKAGDRWDFLSLEHLAALAEFESDSEAVKALVAAAKSGRFDHTVQRLRDIRCEAQERERVRAELADAGVTIVEQDTLVWPASRLSDHGIDPVEHASCPGHAAYAEWGFVEGERRLSAVVVCRDVLANGHVEASAVPVGELGRSLSEEEKAARRVVLDRNRQWRSAETVRREWLRGFAARRSAPVGAERFIASSLLAGDHCVRTAMETGWPLLREAVGITADPGEGLRGERAGFAALIEMVSSASPKRAVLLTAAAVLCAWEARSGVHTWRNPSGETSRYLGQMVEWGYELSEIETIAIHGEPRTTTGPEDSDDGDEAEEPTRHLAAGPPDGDGDG
jgi:ParB family transcriptional regulator, chromosome partitioning protein